MALLNVFNIVDDDDYALLLSLGVVLISLDTDDKLSNFGGYNFDFIFETLDKSDR